ncbi:MAG: preprotein translocase subunit SecE [Elusimicrobia bacterium]|nr:preprotein translocase subunit SecE [Elusimicrobiota bacterium]
MNPVQFVQESWNELRKVTWLTRQQAVGSTIVCIVLISLVAAYVAAIDFVLSVILGALLGRA